MRANLYDIPTAVNAIIVDIRCIQRIKKSATDDTTFCRT